MLRTASIALDRIEPPSKDVLRAGDSWLVLRPSQRTDGYEIVSGHARYERAVRAGRASVFCLIREPDCADPLDELAEIHTIGGRDPLEEALALHSALLRLRVGQRELAKRTGISQSHISKRLKLLELPPAIRSLLAQRRITIEEALRLARASATNPAAPDAA
jgi:ParB family transcriptional regulator, chromosome partitioning protein